MKPKKATDRSSFRTVLNYRWKVFLFFSVGSTDKSSNTKFVSLGLKKTNEQHQKLGLR